MTPLSPLSPEGTKPVDPAQRNSADWLPSPSNQIVLPQQPTSPISSSCFTRFLNRFQLSPETVVLLLAVLIGGSTGMGVVMFRYLIELVNQLMLDLMGVISVWGAWTLACVPMIGGLIVGLMRGHEQDFGPGLSALIAAAQGSRARHSIPRLLQLFKKVVAASVSLGSGASLGPEGPSVEIGANFGMLLGQVLQMSQERQRLLLGAGAAAGLAAGFNAPVAGVFFALEVVLGTTFASSAVSVVLLSAVVAALIAQIGLGAQPAFTLPVYEVRSPLEFPLYMGLGVAASLVSIAYTQAIRLARECFEGHFAGFTWLKRRIPRAVHPLLGGACVGLVAMQWPQILGIGYETVEAMLQDVEFSWQLLVVLLVLKLVLSAISLGSGLVGGIFAPAMFLGASLGAAYAKILAVIAPPISVYMAAPPAYAMVGMAAVLAASAKAPLTAILLLFELTRDYRIVLPLMAAVGLSVWLLERSSPHATSGSNLQELGLNIEKDQNLEILQQMLVMEAMNKSVLMLRAELSVLEAGLCLTSDRCRSAVVINEAEQMVGIVTLEDINRAISLWERYASAAGVTKHYALDDVADANLPNQKLIDICTTEILYAYTDEPLSEALDRMAARGLHQLPVVDRDNHERVLGLLEREQILMTCKVAATRQALRHYLPVPSKTEELPLPTLKESACLPFEL